MHYICSFGWWQVITVEQIRAARATLRWTATDLASAAGVAVRTVAKIEKQTGVPDARTATLTRLQECLESAGIEFIGTPEDAPGIRLHKTRRQR